MICLSCTKATWTWTFRLLLRLGHVWLFPTSAFTFCICILHQSCEVLIGSPTVPPPPLPRCAVLRFWNTSPIPNPTRPVSQVTHVRCGDVWNSFATWKLICNCSELELHNVRAAAPERAIYMKRQCARINIWYIYICVFVLKRTIRCCVRNQYLHT